MTEFKELCIDAHATAMAHGWWAKSPTFGESIALILSEPIEALQEYRNGHPIDETYGYTEPKGVPIELADCVIRIMDFCEHYGIDLEKAIRTKMAYNEKRPYRHGGKVI